MLGAYIVSLEVEAHDARDVPARGEAPIGTKADAESDFGYQRKRDHFVKSTLER